MTLSPTRAPALARLEALVPLDAKYVGLRNFDLGAGKNDGVFCLSPNIRKWDRLLWPHATAGFFKLKDALPKIHASLTPMRKDDLFPEI